jgi:tryptophan 2,3-dioxygenase
MSYGDYLQLDAILGAQQPAVARPQRDAVHRPAPDQRAVDEADAARAARRHRLRGADELPTAFKMLARVSKIMEQLVHAWDVLATMTPPEYSAIRPYLASPAASRAAQYRCIEFALGNKNAAMLKPHAHRPDLLAMVQAAYEAPSLYDEALRLLARRGLAVPPATRSATGRSPTPRATRSRQPGWWSTATRSSTGTCTSWARS